MILLLLLFSGALFAADAELPLGVRSVLKLRQLPPDTLSIFVADVDTGETVLAWHSKVSRNPASTMKILTTLVALDQLGPTYRWQTDVFANGEVKNGILEGDLILKGYGDPFMVSERLWQFMKDIRRAGVREISGDLLLDDSWFDVSDVDPGAFDGQPLRAYNVAPNALLMNFKVVRYRFVPNKDANSVTVTLDPMLGSLQIDNRLRLADSGCKGFQRGIAISSNAPMDTVTFAGRFPRGCARYAMDRTALSHNAYVHDLFTSLWRETGGLFDGGWRNVIVEDPGEPLLSFRSLPLREVITRVNKHSNNVMARQLLFTMGAENGGAPGTQAKGVAAMRKWLFDHHVSASDIVIENGAGLSRNSRISTADMGTVLAFAWKQPYMPEFLASLPLSGLDGTLRRRFKNTNLVGQAHLKTGSLDHVTAIAGYLQARSGRRFALSVMQNHDDIHRGPGEEIQEALLNWLYEQ
jgi:D-alanyl-D-alanine carboxypeptidase/D-alanyl-D-alanine-endopeptidase (penicillin-binding protein 4)